ncbi:hypothetical protein [Rathayibacter sp. VKM Ac-2927]|uniref:hypothetical protein n=1 Tax=Rathayibacter sp. VKM Ac-2927 TaxID=2929478 RepID=UPI001FB27A16|nr:hypothetical protein [Rathayibacter sp. VKM Ac-2927]MCJ1687869.1 hypothetical protein [Rathayibacter sp. VKM Ac-2927]
MTHRHQLNGNPHSEDGTDFAALFARGSQIRARIDALRGSGPDYGEEDEITALQCELEALFSPRTDPA